MFWLLLQPFPHNIERRIVVYVLFLGDITCYFIFGLLLLSGLLNCFRER